MRLRGDQGRFAGGSILVVALVVTALIGLILFSYLTMIGSEAGMTARSQAWNSAMAVAEAGVEEALAHLNENGVTKLGMVQLGSDLASEGWIFETNVYYLKRALGENYYEVTILPGSRPVITSRGYVPTPLQTAAAANGAFLAAAGGKPKSEVAPWEKGQKFISRAVEVKVRAVGKFSKAIVARDKMELNGKYVYVDSFHSYDGTASTSDGTHPWGLYDPAKRRDHGDLAVMDGLSDELSINDAKVFGKVATGPSGDIKNNKNAVVGSAAWHDGGNVGVEPGWSTSDANFDMPSVEKPFNSGQKPVGGTVGTNTYDYILFSGDYELNKLSGSVLVTGQARLLVKDKIEFKSGATDNEGIDFAPGGYLELYMDGKDATLVGTKNKKGQPTAQRGFNSGGNATNFFYFGTDKNLNLELANVDEFSGIIYAPNAEVKLKAGSLKYYKFHATGSVQGKKVKLEKNANFHYDENIGSLPADSYVVESWTEI